MRKKLSVASVLVVGTFALSACAPSTRTIDPAETGSFKIPGTSWYGFCQGPNAFIWIPSVSDSAPDELEAVIYDDFRCVRADATAKPSGKPDTDPDGVIDDED